ncbi:tetratricopeptide repeat protein [Pseudanabaena sp. FACHB-1277]|jgi:hypothetical protein|uniref:Tetratricopeptide repeat protein n=1 Tax=Pseudanabaena cinerea FACHB-1277 TaxID=2949581 RepID=A0A926UQQ8_9CYAN|nr:tetratricopeptide repeat protein [Pseudanabaena cinerea]MBD2149514.1 tetratricopeptide repeat protein [Pseudanabaena cinerea FACHB-1277]
MIDIHQQQPERKWANISTIRGLYDSQGKYSEAEPLMARSLEIYEQKLGTEHPTTQNAKRI